jgi:UrcA family protein
MNIVTKARSASIVSAIAATVIALAGVANGGAAQAAEPSQPLTKTVTYGDLNLNSEQGAKVLYARLRHAASDVCYPLGNIELTRRRQWQSCIDNAVASAVQKVNSPLVTALHNVNASRPSAG